MKSGTVNSRHVAGARWLVFFWLKAEGVDVNTNSWDVFVVLVWLDKVEVSTFSFGESVVTVKLELGSFDWVLSEVVGSVVIT